MDQLIEPTDLADVADADLSTVAALAAEQLAAEAEVARAETALKAANERLAAVRDDRLPTAMLAAGVSEFRTADGARITIRDHYRCGQLDDAADDEKGERRPLIERLAALEWLDLHGHGDLARRVVTVTLGADAEELAHEIIALLRAHRGGNSLRIDHRRAVPWNTLSGFVREQVRHGEDPPMDVLGVTPTRSAKITRPKAGEGF